MTGFDSLYFSFGTFTNYHCDIVAVSHAARTLGMVQATVGVFYLALLVSRLVGLYSSNRPTESSGGPTRDPANDPKENANP
jgi:hypothetical protein